MRTSRELYRRLFELVCGEAPGLRRWHPQWVAGQLIYADVREWLSGAEGRVLDVGCGDKPYVAWAPRAREFLGIDVQPGPRVDAVIEPNSAWPLEDGSFDVAVCTQVLQHDPHVPHTLGEIHRVLAPGGRVVLTAPFIYNELRMHDYWRFSAEGLLELLGDRYEVIEVRKRGGIASSLMTLLANWSETSLAPNRTIAVIAALTLPLRLLVYAIMNTLAVTLDKLDRTGAFYANVSVLARKPREGLEAPTPTGY